MTQLAIQAKTTKTAQYIDATGVDVSGITGDWTLVLEVLAQNDANVSRFVFEDSNNSFTTYNTDIFPGPSASISGAIEARNAPKRYTWQKRDFPNARFGVASTFLRLTLTEITGSSKSVTYQAHVEY